jgi:hypothetical protein
MKNVILCIVFPALLFAMLWSCPAKADVSPDLVEKVRPATVMIYVLDRAGNVVAQGSGFFFKEYGHLITNYHVLGKATMAKVRTPDGREFNIKSVLAEDQSDDVIEALVDVSYGSVPYLNPAYSAPKAGEPIVVIGSPLGVDKVVSEGHVHAIMEVPKLGRCIVHSAHSFHGSSGSPVVNGQGEVVGIETAAIVGKPDVQFAIPVERFTGLNPNYREFQAVASAKTTVRGEVQGPNVQPETLQEDIEMADAGDPEAEVRLAARYEQGRELSKSCFDALSLYRKAANQGYLQAQYHIGLMYYNGGECMGQDLGEAAKWLKTAAERGLADAQRVYGKMCFNGEGVTRDRVTACMWMILASSRGSGEAKSLLKFMTSELTQDELSMAREKARNWKSSE